MNKQEKIPFTKMMGTGNDFIVFDNRSQIFTGEETEFFASICQRRISVGADGVILLEESESAEIKMRYFNSDGHEASMCGNGARCIAFFAWDKGIVDKNDFFLEASDGVHTVKVDRANITLKMGKPTGFQQKLGILRESEFVEGGFINTGVPHYVIFVKNIEKVAVEEIGRFYRNHQIFPQGTNVNFVELLGVNTINVRTYERGVEKETLSCGTGAVASALVAAYKYGYKPPVKILTRGGELIVNFDEKWEEVFLAGKVKIVYEGFLPTFT